ncbi:MAG: hypothetical protein IJ809_03590 [Clostridia bacterium]|nr:hypothetical protein [Clostridia bacterium]
MYGAGVEGKTSVKESMINMSAGIVFFYIAQGVYDFAKEIIIGMATSNDFSTASNIIWGNVVVVVKALSLIGLAAVGLKYMFTNADTKADIKRQLFPVILGLVLIYCVTSVANTIIEAGKDILGSEAANSATVSGEGTANQTVKNAVGNIYSTAASVFQVLAVAAVVFTGIRYMFASADTRADIKGQTIILLAGSILVFGGIEVAKAVQKAGNDILPKTSVVIEQNIEGDFKA